MDLFPPDFIQSVVDDFDPSIFTTGDRDLNLNFERDFGQWFNGGDDVGALDMK